ncbi:hypothetical protein FKP32DRAFT_44326 [Trametes sanguinea]|nr:hypothetical protein FKP32DRAFT_44326 [Trametes sanguinea]
MTSRAFTRVLACPVNYRLDEPQWGSVGFSMPHERLRSSFGRTAILGGRRSSHESSRNSRLPLWLHCQQAVTRAMQSGSLESRNACPSPDTASSPAAFSTSTCATRVYTRDPGAVTIWREVLSPRWLATYSPMAHRYQGRSPRTIQLRRRAVFCPTLALLREGETAMPLLVCPGPVSPQTANGGGEWMP